MLPNNLIALIVTLILCLIWLRLNDFAAQRGWIDSALSRKIIHTGTGPLFVLCWLLFKNTPDARWLAALVPGAITLQFLLVGLGVLKDEASVKAMSRSGDRREILRGPLYYGIAFVVLTILFWYDSPVGMVALMLLCGGDGLADIFGRRIASAQLPWNARKSWAGSLSMLLGGGLMAALLVVVYVAAGIFKGPWTGYLPGIAMIALAGALVESLPLPDVDNITVTVTAVVLGMLLF